MNLTIIIKLLVFTFRFNELLYKKRIYDDII